MRVLHALERFWEWLRTLYCVLLLVRFSLLLGLVGGLVLLVNDQAQDVLRALAEDWDSRVLWFLVAAVFCATVAWWASRVMFYFEFDNRASSPSVMPRLKDHLPRLIGALALLLVGAACFWASLGYTPWASGAGGRLLVLAASCVLLAGIFLYVTTKRRQWFARYLAGVRPANLPSLTELPWQAWGFLVGSTVFGFALMVLFAYQAVTVAPALGTGAVAMLAAAGLIPVGSALVYAGNRFNLPVVTALLVLALLSTYVTENHFVRLDADMRSYQTPPARESLALDADADLAAYFREWIEDIEPGPDGSIPVFIVAAEGGGIRAAYWTALVLGELQDRAMAEGRDFARHVFAISGVSGGSLGAATFAALIANERGGLAAKPDSVCLRPFLDDAPGARGIRARGERVLGHDFLSPAVSVMLFPDLFQKLVPIAFLDDRGLALEESFEAAWNACEEGARFSQPFAALWPEGARHGVPLLFLNTTVVETGQRLIAAPVSVAEPEFSNVLDSTLMLGADVPLSTAVHNSARFTYASPAGTVRAPGAVVDGRTRSRWIRLVDGGYFENSGAVTAAEILRVVQRTARTLASERGGGDVRPIVIHISNDPEAAGDPDLGKRRRLANQPLAPIKALLNTRHARGLQARENLAKETDVHLHFGLCRDAAGGRRGRYRQPLPLGWALSNLAREEMGRQLGVVPGESTANLERNRASIEAVLAALSGRAGAQRVTGVWSCPLGAAMS